MARTVAFSNAFKTGAVALTATPQIALTNNSTYTAASSLAAVTAEEVSGNGYTRINLTVNSNTVTVQGFGQIVYNTATVTASGGNIVFDRAAIIADGEFVGYTVFGTTTINDGVSYPFPLPTLILRESGTVLTGSNGVSATTTSTASFTQPAASATVTVSMVSTAWLAVGSNVYFTNGTNVGWYEVTAIDSPTSATLENLGLSGSASAATVMTVGTFVCTGAPGADGAPGLGLRYTFSSTITAPPSSGELRVNNATIASVTSIFVHETDRNSATVSSVLAGISNGSIVMLSDENAPNLYAYFTVTAQADNGAYRTLSVTYITGTAGTFSGNVSLMTGGSPSRVETFTGDNFSYTPIAVNNIAIRTDTDPPRIHLTTVTAPGGAMEIGTRPYFFLKYVIELNQTPSRRGRMGTVGLNTLVSPLTTIYLSNNEWWINDNGVDLVLDRIQPGSILQIEGQDSGDIGYYLVASASDNGTYRTIGVSLIDSYSGGFTNEEFVNISFLPPSSPVYTAISTNTTLSATQGKDHFIDASAGNITLTVPLSATATNKIAHLIKRIDDGTAGYSVTLARSGSDLIDGETSQSLSALGAVNIRADGVSNWWVY